MKKLLNTPFKKGIVLLFIFMCAFLLTYFLLERKNGKIRLSTKLTKATVIKVDYFDKHQRHKIDYSFQDMKKNEISSYIFKDNTAINKLTKLENRVLIVAYDSLNSNNNKLLITDDDYSCFNIPYPDSLNWVKDLLKE